MWIGGDGGSTAGGVKILRLLLALRLLQVLLLRTAVPPHAVVHPRAEGAPIDARSLQTSLAIIALYLMVPLAAWLVFLFAGYPALPALFEVVSAVGTVGLSAGIAAPELPAALKALLCLVMLLRAAGNRCAARAGLSAHLDRPPAGNLTRPEETGACVSD